MKKLVKVVVDLMTQIKVEVQDPIYILKYWMVVKNQLTQNQY